MCKEGRWLAASRERERQYARNVGVGWGVAVGWAEGCRDAYMATERRHVGPNECAVRAFV